MNGTFAYGKDGGNLGFGGIPNSLAIAFDTWTNPGDDLIGVDNVKIQSLGVLPNSGHSNALLGIPRIHQIADGAVHLVRITYYGELRSQYLNQLIASDSLMPYLFDNGEQKRVGTLVVYMDEGIAADVPLLAMPINLSLLLNLPNDKAYVGFTASTGRFYEKHDILSWIWCDQEPCDPPKKADFDYHQQSAFSSVTTRAFEPGPGDGGGDAVDGFPTKNQDPNTAAWAEPVEHFSLSRNFGLATDGVNQVPPSTLY